jgi:adenosylcobinamide-GDP ribazoletransferase
MAALAGFGLPALVAILAAAAAVAAFSALCSTQIGGHTGDTIGAAQQIAETALLAGLTLGLSPVLRGIAATGRLGSGV